MPHECHVGARWMLRGSGPLGRGRKRRGIDNKTTLKSHRTNKHLAKILNLKIVLSESFGENAKYIYVSKKVKSLFLIAPYAKAKNVFNQNYLWI